MLAAPEEAVPASVRDAVLARLARLPPATRPTLELLASVPGEIEADLLNMLIPASSLGTVLETGLVIKEGSSLRFRHELARRAIESGTAHTRLIENNRQIAAALIELGSESARIVHHGVMAHDDETVARFAPLAARSALEDVGYREALAFSLLALERRRFADPAEEALLHGWAARSLFALNRFGAAASQADLAVNLWDSLGERPIELGEALLISSRLSTVLGDPTSARAKSERALAILEPLGPSHALASCFATMGSQAVLQSRFEEGAAWCDRAIALGRELNHKDVVARALCFLGLSKTSLGDEAGFEDLRQGIQVAEEIDHGDSLSLGANNMAVALIRAGRYAEAESYLDLGERTARAHGLDRALFHTEAQKCEVLMLRGHWGEADARLRRLLDAPVDPGANLVPPLSLLGRIATRTGQPDAKSLVDRAWSIASSTGEHHKMARAVLARLEWAVLNQDAAIAAGVAREVIAQAARTQHVYLRAEALRLLGRLGETVEVFDGCPQPYAASIAGDWKKAAALWDQANNPYEKALDLCESPDPTIAFAGLAILDRLGAIATAGWMRRRLRLRGMAGVPRGPRSVTRDNPGRLTRRQLEVVGLMGEGLTNQQIANRLYLSRRTVDNHVAAILATLGASTRQDAVAKVGS